MHALGRRIAELRILTSASREPLTLRVLHDISLARATALAHTAVLNAAAQGERGDGEELYRSAGPGCVRLRRSVYLPSLPYYAAAYDDLTTLNGWQPRLVLDVPPLGPGPTHTCPLTHVSQCLPSFTMRLTLTPICSIAISA